MPNTKFTTMLLNFSEACGRISFAFLEQFKVLILFQKA